MRLEPALGGNLDALGGNAGLLPDIYVFNLFFELILSYAVAWVLFSGAVILRLAEFLRKVIFVTPLFRVSCLGFLARILPILRIAVL